MNEKNRDNSTIPSANLESSAGDASLGEEKAQGFNGRVSISIHSQRNTFTDSDGACSKYAIDAIVTAKLLRDDSPEYVPESPRKTQEKMAGMEVTTITIEEIC